MISHRIPLAGDPFTAKAKPSARPPSTRHHRVDHGFIALLEEDFGMRRYALVNAFLGVPAEPKKSAIKLCAWAVRQDEPARALLNWARRNQRGTFRPEPSEADDAGG